MSWPRLEPETSQIHMRMITISDNLLDEGNIKVYLREINCEDVQCIEVAQGTVRRRNLVMILINLWFPQLQEISDQLNACRLL
jgi:hypothetical protein